jgi:hypothetical protein
LCRLVFSSASGRISKLHQKWAGVPVKNHPPCFERLTSFSQSDSILGKRKISEILRGAGKSSYNRLIFNVVPEGNVRMTSPMMRGLKPQSQRIEFLEGVRSQRLPRQLAASRLFSNIWPDLRIAPKMGRGAGKAPSALF